MPSEPDWLSPEEIIELNAAIVEETGEPHHVLSHGLLESACNRPQNAWLYGHVQDVVGLACELLFGIARNHAFAQGNKRTGLEAAIIFLHLNGYRLTVEDTKDFADMIIEVITYDRTQASFEDFLASHIVELDAEYD